MVLRLRGCSANWMPLSVNTRAITVAAREFATDLFIITRLGTTLGGAAVQSLILSDWLSLRSNPDFQGMQAAKPLLVSMELADQRALVV